MSNRPKLDREALKDALVEAHMRGYGEGVTDALTAAADAFANSGSESVAAVLRQMVSLAPTVITAEASA